MFRRPPRNFRGRQRAASSCSSSSSSSEGEPEPEPEREQGTGSEADQGEEEQEQGPARPAAERQPPAEGPAGDTGGREEQEDGGGVPRGRPRGANPRAGQARGEMALLSFGADEERDEGDELFKIKKPSLNTITFRMQKKESPHSAVRETERSKEIFQSESRIINTAETCETEEDEHYSSASEDYSSSASETQSSPPQTRKDLSAGNIPDAAYMQVACRKHQLARTKGDYIPLDASHRAPVSQKKACSDTESEDDSDHDTILHFAPKTKSLKQRMAEYVVPKSDGASEDDEIQNMWEEQQLKKAVRLPQGMNVDTSLHKSRTMKIKFDPSVSLPPVNLEIVKKRLNTRITSLQDLHRAHQREHEKYTQDIESSKSTIQELERSSNAALNYKFYRSMKTYVESLIDCLNEKLLHINELESAMQMLLQQQAITHLKHRQEDLKNESAYVQLLSRKNGKSAGDSLEDDEKTKQLLEKSEARRTCRRQARECLGKSDHHEGMSSDDELSAAEKTDFQKNKDDILQESKKICEDVHADFCNIRNILLKFQQWRQKFPDTYYDAYISLCLPKLLSPLIRIQLIGWNPLENFIDLNEMAWFRAIEEFTDAKNMPQSKRSDDDPDQTILPTIIEKTILPKITGFVEHVWDPLSTSQTVSLVQLCKNIFEEHSLSKNESSKAKEDLVNSIVSRMKKSIEEDVFIPLYPKNAVEDRISPQSKFQERQFWSAVKLLSNILLWDGIILEDTLHELGLGKLLNRYLLLILLNAPPGPDNVEKCNKVVACLPERWFKELKSGSTLPQLANFSQHLLQSAHTLYKNNCSDETRDLILLLVKVNALHVAEDFIEEYKLEYLKSIVRK
ncbi:intron Large complex component GCFC2 isoform X2 [Gopherus flavomarginatus]|uniref:intron Large complex component GCFC2 isoform X2 n=1 Tax=Gopherus flavomarginatus TaxID=286002 RepID=UPI0021CBA97B|nr:intron Large complex component GCFC2 isoform X2 [Gopherus flavomarginatus]